MQRFAWIAAALRFCAGVARADALLINGAGATFPFPLDYAPLPKPVVAKVEAALRAITVGGKSVIASN